MPLTVTMKEGGGFDLHEEGEYYEGTVTGIEELTDGQFGPGLKWFINIDGEINDDTGEPRDTWAFCSQTLSPRSKLYKWVKGILGEAAMPSPGEALDLGKLVGARVKVMFEQVPAMDAEGNPTTKEKVVAIKAAGEVSAVRAAATEPTPVAPQTSARSAADTEPF